MTPEEQRIAIAEACGWKWHGDPTWQRLGDSFYWKKGDVIYCQLLDYLNDLNAMHSAEETLSAKQWRDYNAWLYESTICQEECGCADIMKHKIHAAAVQRVEAFLRTVGKWDDSK